LAPTENYVAKKGPEILIFPEKAARQGEIARTIVDEIPYNIPLLIRNVDKMPAGNGPGWLVAAGFV